MFHPPCLCWLNAASEMLSVGKIVESKGCVLTGHTAQIRVQKDAFGITSALKSVII